ncbi:MAG: hypothetical protein ACRCV9_09090 [Burkholderiaceae bacterium]
MNELNTAFDSKSNTTFTTQMAGRATLPTMHLSMQRLFELGELRGYTKRSGAVNKSALATAIGARSQDITNWERRGISCEAALNAARKLRCNAVWLYFGEGPMEILDHRLLQEAGEVARKLESTLTTASARAVPVNIDSRKTRPAANVSPRRRYR